MDKPTQTASEYFNAYATKTQVAAMESQMGPDYSSAQLLTELNLYIVEVLPQDTAYQLLGDYAVPSDEHDKITAQRDQIVASFERWVNAGRKWPLS